MTGKHVEHKHKLPIKLRTLVLSDKMKCKDYDNCKTAYDYFSGSWRKKKK